jgi:Undecaprenyl-phosphate galactose phosphotransferase WbaP
MEGVAVCRVEHLRELLSSGVKHAIVAAPELSESEFAEVLERGGNVFPHMIIIPDTHFVWKSGSYTRDLVGMLGLQVGNNLLRPESKIAKRAIDLGLCVILVPFLLFLTAIIAACIAVESGFPVFYSQERIGYDGRVFRIWKFRTMVKDAAAILERTLASDPQLRTDWMANQKLCDDPRITRVGKILRKSSLDELPQLWNVIKGEMSLVGPRPIVHEEIAKYSGAYSQYTKTTPGVTGLWQVSGRSRTSYAERVAYDTYYVRNWSVWLDIYLLAKTVGVILTGDGAY